ncbi:MAG: choice-of-anchor P family protein [Panacagrimonas sp.]
MKTSTLLKTVHRSIVGGGLAICLGFAPAVSMANGTEELGAPVGLTLQAGAETVAAGTGLVATGSGVISVNLPLNATVKQVILYWEGRGPLAAPEGLENQVSLVGDGFAGPVVGSLIGGPIPGLNPSSRAYRLDISSLNVIKAGTNLLEVTRSSAVTQAASIIVVYDQPLVSYGGRAIGAKVQILKKIPVTVVDTGPLPPTGGTLEPAPVLNVPIPGLLASKTVSASTVGMDGGVISKAAIDGTKLTILGGVISAKVINSKAIAECEADGSATVSGSSKFLDLKVLKLLKLPLNFNPNKVVLNLGLVKVVANEQIKSVSGGNGSITVNGLHVTTPLVNKLLGGLLGIGKVADIVLASSTAEVHCSLVAPKAAKLVDGVDLAFGPFAPPQKSTVEKVFTFPVSTKNRTAKLSLFVGDAEASRPDTVVIKVNGAVVQTIDNSLDASNGNGADVDTITISIPAGSTSVGVQLLSQANSTPFGGNLPDSIFWVYALFTIDDGASNLYSGQATVLKASVLGLVNVALGDTGAIPSSGGSFGGPIVDVPLLPLLSSLTGEATVEAAGEKSFAKASVEKLGLLLLGLGVTADVISTTATAECDANNVATTSGTSEILNLNVNGGPIVLNGTVNFEIPILGGKILVNERIESPGSITVNAIHVIVPNPLVALIGGDDLVNVVVASSHADIVCN